MRILIVLSLVAGAFAFLDCPANQHYESCGTKCPLTCDNYNDPPTACVLMCNPGCHCDKGYVKTEDGECVKPENCPSKNVCTGENEQYNECGTACPLTCDNYQNPPKACTLQCVIGCGCKDGYVKDVQGRCVLPENCPATSFSDNLCELPSETGMCRGYFPRYHFNKASGQCEKFIYGGCGGNGNNFKTIEECQKSCAAAASNEVCGENEVYATCGTACPLTCDNLHNPPKICTLQCVIGCQCARGYVRNSQGRCVSPDQCPARAVCGENQEFQNCGTACPLTCENLDNPPKFCTKQCVIGCQCQRGYVKNSNGECVLPEECPSRAHSYELCELPAEPGMCRGYFPKFYFNKASGSCEEFIYGGCGGNGNNFDNLEDCHRTCAAAASNEVCGENEEYATCGTACPLTCDNLHNPPKVCTLQCVIGCQCARGYVRNSQGKCVLPEQCPSKAVCGENSRFTSCGTACPLTCDNYQNPPKFCTYQCVIGCECEKGYVKHADGRCVLPEQCQSVQSALDRPDCDKGPEVGVCKARMHRYYYDQEAGMCKTFIYGGCGGNRNNFASRDECLNKCGALAAPKNALCEQERVVGPCRAAFRRYFYNKQTGQCEFFIYGGCHGNSNNFHSKDECESTCVA